MPPRSGGRYLRVLGRECARALAMRNVDSANGAAYWAQIDETSTGLAPRCVLGRWDGGAWGREYAGDSWDAVVLSVPLPPAVDPRRLAFPTHVLGAENRLGYELIRRGGLQLHNPCLHVRAEHWHCHGAKGHGRFKTDVKVLPQTGESIFDLYPCWDCPGVQLPAHRVPRAALCTAGHECSLGPRRRTILKRSRHAGQPVKLCCQPRRFVACMRDFFNASAPPHMFKLCESPTDVGCVLLSARYAPSTTPSNCKPPAVTC